MHVALALSSQDIIEWDIIEYWEPDEGDQRRLRLGLVASIQESPTPTLMVEPLVMEEEGVWTHDDRVSDSPQPIGFESVLRVVEADFSQRQDKVGPGNPHGEHAHDVFLPLVPLAPDVFMGQHS